jgi:hypothetical protein
MIDSEKPTTKRDLSDTRLSYSSMNTINACEQKYFHYKILGSSKDPDFEESFEAFNFGTAFHYVNEKTQHLYPKSKSELEVLLTFCQTRYDLDNESRLKLKACLIKYWDMSTKSGLTCVLNGIEVEVSNSEYIGYVDAVMWEPDKSWWIVDLKTAGMLDKGTIAHLGKNEQLNLYSYFVPQISEKLNLDPLRFKGCRYRVTLKSKMTYGKKDTDETFTKRVLATIKTYDYVVDKKELDPVGAYLKYKKSYYRSQKFRDPNTSHAPPEKNYKACFDYFRPCEYWSNCHGGETFTKAMIRMGLAEGE